MPTKTELKIKLDKLGIRYLYSTSKADLEYLLTRATEKLQTKKGN